MAGKFKKLRILAKTYVALNRINSDVTYGLAVQCAVGHKGSMSPSNVEDMVSDVVKTKSESDAATVIRKYRDEATRSEASKNARHARLPEALANRMLNDAKRFARNMDKGLEKLYLASLTDHKRR